MGGGLASTASTRGSLVAGALLVLACGGPAGDPEPADADHRARVQREIEALGYVTSLEEAPQTTGVLRHDSSRAWNGFNLYTSGHDAVALLIDMEGREVHRWRRPYHDIWPDREFTDNDYRWRAWRFAHLLPDGDLLVIFENLGMVRLDRDSNVVWAADLATHHDLEVLPDGSIYTLTSHWNLVERINPERRIKEDFITRLDADGELVGSFSLLDAWERSAFADELDGLIVPRGDTLHTNTLQVFDGSLAHLSPLFRRGNILTSFREIDTIGIVDPETETLIWRLTGPWGGQHYPTLIDEGRILLFANNHEGHASWVEMLDPTSGEAVWTYRGSPPRSFFSRRCGHAQLLANGHVLATESQAGRAIEVDPAGEIVWEFISPYRMKKRHRDQIAYLYILTRIEASRVRPWLGAS